MSIRSASLADPYTEKPVFFNVISSFSQIPLTPGPIAYLMHSNWDDWFHFQTQYLIVVVDSAGTRHHAGSVKIGQMGLLPGGTRGPNTRVPELDPAFDELPAGSFSLGQGETYYETLNTLDTVVRNRVLEGLKDCAFNLALFDTARDQQVMKESLLRELDETTVRRRLNRLAHGNAVLTPFTFDFIPRAAMPMPLQEGTPPPPEEPPMALRFQVIPESYPPTNVHVIIGRNGVGKSRFLKSLANTVLNVDSESSPQGRLLHATDTENGEFAGLVFVSFSAFDDFDLPAEVRQGLRATQVGLRYRNLGTDAVSVRTPEQLATEFAKSLESCRRGLRAERWRSALNTLEYDPLFAEIGISRLLDLGDDVWRRASEDRFKRLSSGHAIVLLTITRLVELVDERTLVLLDEPESHLHPPLLSAFLRALADLLVRRNGVALIATHSPVVLQEVPARCVWMLSRNGRVARTERPPLETFGENVSVLTREIFRLDLTNTGFHTVIRQEIDRGVDYEQLLARFGQQLGAEARALARALVFERAQRNE